LEELEGSGKRQKRGEGSELVKALWEIFWEIKMYYVDAVIHTGSENGTMKNGVVRSCKNCNLRDEASLTKEPYKVKKRDGVAF
jgi:hypothetical protein